VSGPPYLFLNLMPVPRAVQDNLLRSLPGLLPGRSRVLLYSDSVLTRNLWVRGAFAGLRVLGILDRDAGKAGTESQGLPLLPLEALRELKPDAVLVTHLRQHGAIARDLAPLGRELGFQVLDLCSGFSWEDGRHEFAAQVQERLWDNLLEGFPRPPLEVWIPPQWGFGDRLCALSAARELARRNPGQRVLYSYLPEVVAAYGDALVQAGSGGYQVPDQSCWFHYDRDASLAGNYLGCYYLGLGLDFTAGPLPELPPVPPLPGLAPGSYLALQPRAGSAKPDPSDEALQALVEAASLPVVAAGAPGTARTLRGVDYSHLGGEVAMLSVIRHAALFLGPRSAGAHIAAGYRVPAVIWTPEDGLDWGLDYPGWSCQRVPVRTPAFAQEAGRAAERLSSSQARIVQASGGPT
jgi:hypothetical protein